MFQILAGLDDLGRRVLRQGLQLLLGQLLLAQPLLLLVRLNLLLLSLVKRLLLLRLAALQVARVEVVSYSDFVGDRHGRGRKDLFLFRSDTLLLLKFQLLGLFHALATRHYSAKAFADVIELEMGPGDWASILLVALLLRVDPLVVGEVDIVDVVVIFCFRCHFTTDISV